MTALMQLIRLFITVEVFLRSLDRLTKHWGELEKQYIFEQVLLADTAYRRAKIRRAIEALTLKVLPL